MFKFYLNNTECSQGIANWQDLKISIIRDVVNRIVRIEMPQEMTFTGECYKIIRDEFNANGYCSLIDVRIEKINSAGGYNNFFTGIIFINECEFDEIYKTCVVPIRDNSFISRINNNKEVKFYTDGDVTKNGLPMTPIVSKLISMFRQSDGVINGGFANVGFRAGYDWLELINNCVLFISDNELSVVSDWYTNLPVTENLLLIQGYELRTATHTNEQFYISFSQLTNDIFKAFNLWMTIEGNTIRIEEESYFFNTTSLMTFDNVKEVKQTFAQNSFYSNITIGNNNSLTTGTFPVTKALTFIAEDYLLGGKCNINNTLNLNFEFFLADANLIEQNLLVGTDDSNDEEIFLLQWNSRVLIATDNSLAPLTGHYYNVLFTNIDILERYNLNSSFYNPLYEFLNKFWATCSTNANYNGTLYYNQIINGGNDTNVQPPFLGNFLPIVSMDDEINAPNFDSGGVWNNATNIYTAQTTGLFAFYFSINFEVQGLSWIPVTPPPSRNVQLYMRCTHSVTGNQWVLLYDTDGTDGFKFNGNYTFSGYLHGVVMSAGDTIQFSNMDYGQNAPYDSLSEFDFYITYKSGSFIKCIATPDSGGEYTPTNPDVFKASLFTFDKKLTQAQVNDLLDAPYKAFTFNQDGITNKKVWANEIIINLQDSVASIEAISDIENSG